MAKLNPYIGRIILSGCAVGVLTICYLHAINHSVIVHDFISAVDIGNAMRVFRPMLSLLGVALGWGASEVEGQFNAPPGVLTWCGKAYMAT
jgi:hypothetical protein